MRKRSTIVRGLMLWLMLSLLSVAGFGTPAMAQEARVPTADEIIRKLTQPQIPPERLRKEAVQVEGRRGRALESASIDLAITFEYASSRLTPDARIVLDNLGRALSDTALRESRFRIAGHTDARGSDAYNLTLSRQRARSVADYLVRQHRIDARRLSIEGFGRTQLLDPDNPESAVNRRVQITNLGS